MRSLLPPSVHMLALTATATRNTRDRITETLGMHHPKVISVCPCKSNIFYSVAQFTSLEDSFGTILHDLSRLSVASDRMIVFCSTIGDCSDLYLYFKKRLGVHFCIQGMHQICASFGLLKFSTACWNLITKKRL